MSRLEQIAFLKSVLESSKANAIIATNLDGTLLAWNKGASCLYGYKSQEVIGKNIFLLYGPNKMAHQKVKSIFNEVNQTKLWSGKIISNRKNGSHFITFTTISLRQDTKKRPIGYTIISHDVTEAEKIRRAQEKLYLENKKDNIELKSALILTKKADRAKGEFLANISHELRTPLNAIIGFSQMIHDAKVGPISVQQKDYLGDVLTSARHLLALINQVLDLSRIEAQKIELSPELTNLTQLVNEVMNDFHSLMSKKQLTCDIDIDLMVDQVTLDPVKFKQVLYNFLSNSVKFTPNHGKINITIVPESNNMFCLAVKDTGIGIKKSDLNRLFVPFQKLEAGRRNQYQSSGLGLALSKHLIEAQGGHIGVISSVGKGSTFYAILPRAPLRAAEFYKLGKPTTAPLQVEQTERNQSVLVIEEETEDRNNLLLTLEAAGFIVDTASDGVQALQKSLKKKYDIIIIDLFISDINTWSILRALRSFKPKYRNNLLLIAAIVEKAKSVGFVVHDFLLKPVTPDVLLSTLKFSGALPYQNKSILLVDDDEDNIANTEKLLMAYGYQVETAFTVSGALKATQKQCPFIVLLDPFLSENQGFEFLRQFRRTEKGRYTPIIIWTARLVNNEERQKIKSYVQRVVLKRFKEQASILNALRAHVHLEEV